MKDQLARLMRYDGWANEEALASLRQGPAPPKSLKWMGHIIGAEFLWLSRLRLESPLLPVWPELTVDDCTRRLRQLSDAWGEYLDQISDSHLKDQIAYTNSKGEPWSSTVEEVLTHVVIHSAYHRGQIAADVRAAGEVPAYTDYIHAARQGLV
jgi:uncharacterized damage-inducible protein DinB